MEVVDERLMRVGGIQEAEVKVLIYVALWCIQERAELRPSMDLVVNMLKGLVPVDMPPESRMFMMDPFLPLGSGITSGSSMTPESASAVTRSAGSNSSSTRP